MNAQTLVHFDKWFDSQFGYLAAPEFLILRRKMILMFDEDPAYWDTHTYWQLYNAVIETSGRD